MHLDKQAGGKTGRQAGTVISRRRRNCSCYASRESLSGYLAGDTHAVAAGCWGGRLSMAEGACWSDGLAAKLPRLVLVLCHTIAGQAAAVPRRRGLSNLEGARLAIRHRLALRLVGEVLVLCNAVTGLTDARGVLGWCLHLFGAALAHVGGVLARRLPGGILERPFGACLTRCPPV